MRLLTFLTAIFFLHSGCYDDSPRSIQYAKGDFWPQNFRDNGFPSKAFADDKIYCSSLESAPDKPNFFYCLNLKTGLVDWAVQVKEWASQPPIICDSFIYYCSFTGDIYKFNKDGKQLWKSEFNSTYGGHFLNPHNNNLLVNTVAYGFREIESKTGKIIDSIGYGVIDVSDPLFEGDVVYQSIGDTIFCRKNTSQAIIWKKKTGGDIEKLFFNKQLLYYFENSRLHGLDSRTGELMWQSDSIFAYKEISPHLEFESGMILSYSSNLNDIFVLDGITGKLLQRATYLELQKRNYLVPRFRNYRVVHNKKFYNIRVSNTLFGGYAFRAQFEVSVSPSDVLQ